MSRTSTHQQIGFDFGIPTRVQKVLLTVGFSALAVAAIAAHRSPATGYERSIYAATPQIVWVSLAVAFAVGVVVALTFQPWILARAGAALTALVVVFVALLPIVREYAFLGTGDGLTHLGWARRLASGSMQPWDLLYPGVHSLSVVFTNVFGLDLQHALLLVVALFVVLYLLFLPLCVSLLTDSRRGVVAGALTATLLLPINNVATHLSVHPSSETMLLYPFILFLALAYVSRSFEDKRGVGFGVLLGLASLTVVLFHPQETVTLLAAFGGITAYQLYARRNRRSSPIYQHRLLGGHFVVLFVAFLAWSSNHERARSTPIEVLVSLQQELAPGAQIQQSASSVAGVGGSLSDLFLRLFLPETVFVVLAGLVALATVTGRFTDYVPENQALIKYLTVAAIPYVLATLVLFVASVGDHYFRFAGAFMVFVSILGAAALARWLPDRHSGWSTRGIVVVVAVVFLVLAPVAIATVYSSPMIYQTTGHVSEQEFEGYQTSFAVRESSIEYTGVRASQDRFIDAYYGTGTQRAIEFPGRGESLPTTYRPEVFDDARYVVLTRRDLVRELDVYEGFRYSRNSLYGFEGTPRFDRVYSNGEFRLYRSNPTP